MNAEEFTRWLEGHTAAFPSVAAFVERSSDQAGLLRAWAAALADVAAVDAAEVTQRMVAGAIERPYPEELTRLVKRYAGIFAAARETARPRPSMGRPGACQLCGGSGLVTVWHPLDVRACIEGVEQYVDPTTRDQYRAGRPATAVAVCHCPDGDMQFARQTGRLTAEGRYNVRVAQVGASKFCVPVATGEIAVDVARETRRRQAEAGTQQRPLFQDLEA